MGRIGEYWKGWLEPPTFAAREDNERAATLHTILLAASVVLAVLLLSSTLIWPDKNTYPIYAGMLLLHLGQLALLRSGRLKLSVVSHCLLYVASVSVAMFAMGGIRSPAGYVYPPAVLMAGLVWSGRAAVALAFAISVIGLVLVKLEAQGLLPQVLEPPTPFRLWGVMTGTLVVTAVMLRVALRTIRKHHAENVRLERELEHARRLEAVGRLSAGVAHDFNNLLTVIIGQVSMLPRQDPEIGEALDNVQKAAERGANLTKRLLALGRRQVLHPELVDVNLVVKELEPLLRRLFRENVTLRLELGPTRPVAVDRVQLEQVLINLVSNAHDAIARQGNVRISTGSYPNDIVWLAVEDDGSGIDPEALSHLFEPFFSTKSPVDGTGLGLATAHGIVTQSGGTIEVSSRVGEGSRFEVRLPAAQGEPGATETSQVRALPTLPERMRVLVVDDDPLVRRVTSLILSRAGHDVVVAEDGDRALVLARPPSEVAAPDQQPFDLLVTDVVMPGRTGPELYEALRAFWPGLRVVYCTGYAEDFVSKQGVALPKVSYLPKPFSRDQLLARVSEVMRGQGAPTSQAHGQ